MVKSPDTIIFVVTNHVFHCDFLVENSLLYCFSILMIVMLRCFLSSFNHIFFASSMLIVDLARSARSNHVDLATALVDSDVKQICCEFSTMFTLMIEIFRVWTQRWFCYHRINVKRSVCSHSATKIWSHRLIVFDLKMIVRKRMKTQASDVS